MLAMEKLSSLFDLTINDVSLKTLESSYALLKGKAPRMMQA